MRSTLRTSTAIIASLSIVMGHMPVAALAQEFDVSQCAEGEDEAACLTRLLEEAAAAEEAARLAAEAAAAEEAARLAAEQAAAEEAARLAAEAAAEEAARAAEAAAAEEAARLAAEQAAAEEAARLAAEAAAAEEAARLAAEQAAAEEAARAAAEQAAAEEAARAAEEAADAAAEAVAAEEAARLAAEQAAAEEAARFAAEAAATEEAARLAAEQAAAEEAARLAAEAAAAEAAAASAADTGIAVEDAAPAELPAGTTEDADALAAALAAAAAEAAAAEAGQAADDDTATGTATEPSVLPAPAPVDAAEAPAPSEPASDAEALAAALAEAAAAEALVVEPEERSAEDAAALEAARAAAAASELSVAEPVDPVAETEAEIATAEAEATVALQSLALLPEAAPVVAATEEVITEETARSSDQDFGRLLTATTEAQAAPERDRTGLTGTQGLILGGIAGLAIGTIIAGNREVVNRADDRLVVLRPEGDYQVIRDDDTLLRRPGNRVFTDTFADGSSRNVVTEPDGTQIITVRDRDLRILRRTVVAPDGTRTVLIDDIAVQTPVIVSQLPQVRPGGGLATAGTSADATALARALEAQSAVDRGFSLSQVRSIRAVRDLAPALNLENVTFETGSAAITPDQARQLLGLGRYMADAIARNPREIFLIEGHTDATGSASFNLGLSDRRAETVALALTEYFGVPAQNMVIQGYGEEFLLIPTLENERLNRRVAVRRITDLLRVAAAE
jgi:outer membrane protein OmpA-like peptidoglycan-associated protein